MENGSSGIFLHPFVICPLVDQETNRSYPIANGINGLNGLALYGTTWRRGA
jgi:hypothetical protein